MSSKGRPREFKMDDVLESMMNTFWEKGYEGTSVADIMVATGLQKGSIYKAFKDKEDMFLQALNHYITQCQLEKRKILETAGSPLKGISNLIERSISQSCSKENCFRGCLGVNSMIEVSLHDKKVAKMLKSMISTAQNDLSKTIEKGQRLGEIRDDLLAKDLAEALYTYLAGIMATSKTAQTKARTKRLLAFGIKMLRKESRSS